MAQRGRPLWRGGYTPTLRIIGFEEERGEWRNGAIAPVHAPVSVVYFAAGLKALTEYVVESAGS